MKKIKLLFVAIIVLFSVRIGKAQGNTCPGTPFCTAVGQTFNYPNVHNGSTASGANSYGCLGAEPDPSYFYIKTLGAGPMTYVLSQGTTPGAGNIDVDFVAWGPYNAAQFPNACANLNGACSGGPGNLTANPPCSGGIADCSYSPAATENMTLNSPGAGFYYIIMITNYSGFTPPGTAGTVSLEQTGGPGSDCSITCPPTTINMLAQDTTNFYAGTATYMPNGATVQCGLPFYIFPNQPAFVDPTSDILTPCLMLDFNPFQNNLNTAGNVSVYEGGSQVFDFCNGCPQGTIGGGVGMAGGDFNLFLSFMDTALNHVVSFCNTGTVGSTVVSLKNCWDGTTYAGPQTWNTSTAGCFSLTIPPNADLGSAIYTISPASGSSGLISTFYDGFAYVDPNFMAAGTYTLTYTFHGRNGCAPGIGTYVFTVPTKPIVSIAPSSTTICTGSAVTLTASGNANTYVWSPGGATTAAISVSPTNTTTPTTYTVTGKNTVTGCKNTATATVTVNPSPIVTVNSPTICAGSTATLTANGASTYTWNTGSNANPYTVTPGATSYTVTGATVAGCTNTAVSTITIVPPPSISLAQSTFTTCLNAPVTFTATGTTNYTWTPTTNMTGSNTGNPTVTPTSVATTVYTVTGTTGNCAGSTGTVTLTVNPLPTVSVTATSTSMCSGGSSTLTASGANTYTWTPGATLSPTTGLVVTATPTATTIYTVTGTDANNCVNNDTISITVNPTPTVGVAGGGGNSQTVCGGGLANATVNGITFTVTPTGSVTWTNSNTNLGGPLSVASGSGNIASYPAPTVTVQTVGVITANSTVAGCASTNSTQLTYTITINPIPGETGETITPAGCGMNNGTITGATGTGGSGNYSYQWNNTGGFVPSSSYTNGAGTYPLQIQDNVTGCIYSQNFTISNSGAPSPPAVTPSATAACAGGTIILTANPSAPAGTTYNWTEANGNIGTGDIYTVTNIPSSPNPYTIGVTATSGGCTGIAATTSITVNAIPPAPTYSLPTGPDTAYCQGSPLPLSVNSGTTIPVWYSNNVFVFAGSPYTPPANLPVGTYTYSVIDSIPLAQGGCTNASPSANTLTLSVVVNPTPPAPTYSLPTGPDTAYCQGSTAPLLTVNSGTVIAVWYSNNVFLQSGSTYTPPANLAAGTYTYSVIDSIPLAQGGCTNAPPSANTLTLSLTVNPTPPAPTYSLPTGPDTAYCQGSPLPLSVNSGTTIPVWYSNNVFLFAGSPYTPPANLPVGTYTYSVIDSIPAAQGGCTNASPSANTLTLSVVVNPTPPAPTYSLPIGPDTSYCQGSTAPLLSVNSGTVIAVWYSNNTVINIGSTYTPPAGLASGTYTYSVIDSIPLAQGGCTNASPSANTLTLSLTVNPTPPAPTYSLPTGPDTAYCQGSPLPLSVNSGTTIAAWYSNNTFVYAGSPYTPSANLVAGTYTFSIIDSIPAAQGGCTNASPSANTFTISLTVYPTPTVNVSGASLDTAKCGQATGGVSNININNVSGGTPGYHFQWYSGGQPIAGATSPTLSGQPAGNYNLQVTDTNGCVAGVTGGSLTFPVPAIVQPTASFSTTPSPAVGQVPLNVVFTNQSTNVTPTSTYVWAFGDGSGAIIKDTSHIYTSAGTYSVVMVVSNGSCRDTARVTILAETATTLIIPNIFTPNQDGINDVFYIINTGMVSLTCDIYNRWGQLLHTITAPNQGWDGIVPNGDKAPDGTYMYILQAQGLDGKAYKQEGTVTLIR
jgi:gliding motility-associated-like protein